MRYHRLFTLIIFLVFAFDAGAAVFTVTSNADSGPGTLREALTLAAANGSAEKDFIYFNLPDVSEAGRTITVTSQLPYVSSNLVIDGTSQPGLNFGRSDAKIILMPLAGSGILYGFNTEFTAGAAPTELYGFHIKGFKERDGSAIISQAIGTMLIGASGKGNVFTDNYRAFTGVLTNWKIKSNFIGILPDGITSSLNEAAYTGERYDNLLIGGNTPVEGNLISNNFIFYDPIHVISTVTVKNNLFGTDYTGTAAFPTGEISNIFIDYRTWQTTVYVTDNVFSANAIGVSGDGNAIIKGNYFGTDRTQVHQLGSSNGAAIGVSVNGVVTVGGDTEAEQNVFTNYYSPIETTNFIKCNVVKNHFYCNSQVHLIPYYFDDRVNIKTLTNNMASGHAPPNSLIQLYYSGIKCATTCNPEEWFANTITDKDGNWKYEGPINGKVMVSATYDGNTIGFAPLGLYPEDAKVTDVTCSHLGSIELIENLTGRFTFEWKDKNGAIVGHEQNISGLSPGMYILEVSEDGTCPSMLGYYYVSEQPSEVFPGSVTLDCDKLTATLSASYTGFENIPEFSWEDKDGKIVSTKSTAENLTAGTYYLTIKNANGCNSGKVTYEVLPSAATPIVDESKVEIKNASCSTSDGYIKGLNINAGQYSYRWTNDKQEFAGNNIDLIGVPAGKYTLAIGYGNNCLPIHTSTFEIKELSTLMLNDSSPNITPTKCYESTGSITGITATGAGALKYSWRNETNLEVGTNANLTNQPPGKYMVMVTDDSNCGFLFSAQHEILGINDISIDISQKVVADATCDNFDGSIANIKITGTGLTYSWKNEQSVEVGTSPDLNYMPAGTYTLTVSGGLYCTPVTGQPITIQSTNSVSLDLSGQGGRSSICNESNGSITGLSAPGATTYEWVITGTTTNVGHKLDLTNVPSGFYTLTISNATCSKSYDFEVAGFPPTVFTGITYAKTNTCESFANGTITLNTTGANEEPNQYLWFDEQNNIVGYTKEVQYLKAGNYHLQLINNNYCPHDYPGVFTIESYPKLEIKSYGTVTDATCGVGTGSITATEFKGGSSNYTYQWLDENGTALPGETKNFINNLVPGKYTLHLNDGTCIPGDVTYTIRDVAVTPPTPSADNIQVYDAGQATIKINSPFPTAIYRIYETASSAVPIKDTIGGNIGINVTESRSYFISLTYGYCESARAEVKVFLSALSGGIPNTFTPNGDGINDFWNIPGLNSYPSATINIFNRYGQAVYQSAGYAKPFDGTSKGKQLPAGVYYYIINLKRGDVLSGSVTILR